MVNAHMPVIPASGARRESFLKNDSGQAGMTKIDSGMDFILRATQFMI